MKALPVADAGSTVTVAGVLSARPLAAVVVSLIQLGGLLTYGMIQRALQRQSQHNSLELMEQAKNCQVSVAVHENGRIDISLTAGVTPAPDQLRTSPAFEAIWMRSHVGREGARRLDP